MAITGNILSAILAGNQISAVTFELIAQAYKEGQISYDPVSKTGVFDTGFTDVRVNIGQEVMKLVYNDTGSIILNGKAVYSLGVNIANKVRTIALADCGTLGSTTQVLGLATHDIGIGELGLVTTHGAVRDFDTSTLLTTSVCYLGTAGNMTNTRPTYPSRIVIMGECVFQDATNGIFDVTIENKIRVDESRSTFVTSQGVGAGTFWDAGFYQFPATSTTRTQAAPSLSYGTANVSRAAHVGFVFGGAGTVDTGTVGLRVTGTKDEETGIQVAAQTEVITTDITTLTLNEYKETAGKFSGSVLLELFVTSGAPTAYSLSFNYGFAKYEDFLNKNVTIIGFECVWLGGAADTGADIALKIHKSTGWTYSAGAFVAGNGDICRKSVDQALAPNIANGIQGAYKRSGLSYYVNGNVDEGVLVQYVSTAPNTFQNLNINIVATSEEI